MTTTLFSMAANSDSDCLYYFCSLNLSIWIAAQRDKNDVCSCRPECSKSVPCDGSKIPVSSCMIIRHNNKSGESWKRSQTSGQREDIHHRQAKRRRL